MENKVHEPSNFLCKKLIAAVFTFFVGPPMVYGLDNLNEEAKKMFSLQGTATAVTDYVFRGVSDSDNRPAYQGSLTLKMEKLGLYGAVWGSTTHLVDDETEQDANGNDIQVEVANATLEIDTAIGITNSITDKLSYNVYFIRYNYPDNNYYFAYNEGVASITYGFLTGLIGYSHNVFNLNGRGIYYNLSASFDLPTQWFKTEGLGINGRVGYYRLDPIVGRSYCDYSVNLTKKYKKVTFSLGWVDTNHRLYHNRFDRGRVLGMVTIEI